MEASVSARIFARAGIGARSGRVRPLWTAHDLVAEQLKRARGAARLALMLHWGFNTRIRKSPWDADHILPVAEGGGECDLDNIRTLCLRCHRVVTMQLRERIRRAKVAAMLIAESE